MIYKIKMMTSEDVKIFVAKKKWCKPVSSKQCQGWNPGKQLEENSWQAQEELPEIIQILPSLNVKSKKGKLFLTKNQSVTNCLWHGVLRRVGKPDRLTTTRWSNLFFYWSFFYWSNLLTNISLDLWVTTPPISIDSQYKRVGEYIT